MGAKVAYYEYIRSEEWKQIADAAKRRAGYRCQVCNRSSREVRLNAHHRTYERLGHERPEDITVLCEDCHKLYEDNKRKTKNRPLPQTTGQPTTPPGQPVRRFDAEVLPPPSSSAKGRRGEGGLSRKLGWGLIVVGAIALWILYMSMPSGQSAPEERGRAVIPTVARPTATPTWTATPLPTAIPSPTVGVEVGAAEHGAEIDEVQPVAASTPSVRMESLMADPARTVVNEGANLRGGPGTEYPVVGGAAAGEAVEIVGISAAGDWYVLANGAWIAAFLIDGAPAGLPIVDAPVAPVAAPVQVQPASAPAVVEPSRVEEVVVADAPSDECDPNYAGACIPNVGYDLNCGDVKAKDFQVLGEDRHGFDRDKDGTACES